MAEVIHQPGPFPDDAPFTRFCIGCNKAWPCPDRVARLEPPPPVQRRALERGEVAICDRVGLWWHVVGCAGLDYFSRRGGTVVGYRDGEAGRSFRVLVWHRRVPRLIDLARDHLDPAGCHEPDTSVLRGHAENLVRCAMEISDDKVRLAWLRLATACMERVAA
jgi:hypothetical protein